MNAIVYTSNSGFTAQYAEMLGAKLSLPACAGDHRIDGYFDYVVPPLEGFWWQEGIDGVDYTNKSLFHWNSVIRLPDFVTKADFDWAVCEATKKKKLDCSAAEFLTIDKGFAFRSCISAHLTTNRKRWQRWTHSSRETAMRTTLPTPACTTKSISRTPARSPRKSGKP